MVHPGFMVKIKTSESEKIFSPFEGNSFRFDCHRDLECFNSCCADLRLILTPLDIVNIRKRLGISSSVFLDQYTETLKVEYSIFPMVKLRMEDNESHTCPFVSPEGCIIYEDRPTACRLYPIGRASSKIEGENGLREKFFIVTEQHCLGFRENRLWKLDEWLDHEGIRQYDEMNAQWIEITSSSNRLRGGSGLAKRLKMFFMASYNPDRLRDFFFESSFFSQFDVSDDLKEALKSDDLELLKFGFLWLKFSLFGDKTLKLEASPAQNRAAKPRHA